MALLLNSAATSLAPCLLPVLSQGCVGAFSRLPGWRHHQTGPAQAVAASAAVQFHATASKDSSTPAADAQLSTRNRAALPLGSKAATSKAKQQPRMLMRLQPQFTVGCQLSGNNASRLEAFHTASIQQLLPITHEKAWGQAVDAAAAFSEQAEVTSCGTWEDNPRYLGNHEELSGRSYSSMRQALKNNPHILERMGITPEEFESYDLDHIIPKQLCGPDLAWNLVIMSRSNNRSFGAKVNAAKVREVGFKTWVTVLAQYASHYQLDVTQIKLSLVPGWGLQHMVPTAAAGVMMA